MVFTGVFAWLLAILYSVVSCVEALQRKLWGIPEMVVNSVWVLFWMAAAAAFAADGRCKPSQLDVQAPFTECNAFLAAEAFAWMSFFAWVPSLAISVIDWRRGQATF
jgi:hypothetical protein